MDADPPSLRYGAKRGFQIGDLRFKNCMAALTERRYKHLHPPFIWSGFSTGGGGRKTYGDVFGGSGWGPTEWN